MKSLKNASGSDRSLPSALNARSSRKNRKKPGKCKAALLLHLSESTLTFYTPSL
jgi:hypothetical protein